MKNFTIAVITLLCGLNQAASTHFINKAILKESDQYTVYWNYTETDITFKVVVKTTGWVGFGLSPNGGMYNSDVVLAWFDADSNERFVDAHVAPSGLHKPIVDKYQNWKKLFMSVENGFTTVIFTRKIIVCGQSDSGEVNLDITQTQPIIFAWGDKFEDSAKSFPLYHGNDNRGSKSVSILGSLNQEVDIDMNKIDLFNFEIDAKLPSGLVTEYYCQLFKIPTSWENNKHHVIRYDTIVNNPEHKKFVHHWLFYECPESFEREFFGAGNAYPDPASCLMVGPDSQWAKVSTICKKVSFAWAVGGDMEMIIPPEYGYPVGGNKNDFKYFFIQMHYENPEKLKDIQVKTEFQFYGTTEYRPIEFGVMQIGTTSDPLSILIPPKIRLEVESICPARLTDKIFGYNDNITIFAQLPHTHLAGVEFYSKILRNNKEIEYISNNKFYDSNYQYIDFYDKPITMKKNDEILTKCVYNTEERDSFTFGGLGTYDEMCYNFIWYYPRNDDPTVGFCESRLRVDDFIAFLTNLAQKGDFNWVINNDATFFQDTVDSLNESDKLKDPEYTQKIWQDLQDQSPRFVHDTKEAFDMPKREIKRMKENKC